MVLEGKLVNSDLTLAAVFLGSMSMCKKLVLPCFSALLVQVVLEGKLVNLDVTSPAATLALGLMFLRTNDPAVAAAFALPDTHFALDYVRPDFIMLRILARSLVMQEGVQASRAWVEAQMPPLIKVCSLSSRQPQLPVSGCLRLSQTESSFSIDLLIYQMDAYMIAKIK